MSEIFQVERINYEGKPGFMLYQIHNEEEIASQFIPEESFKDFCAEAGIKEWEERR